MPLVGVSYPILQSRGAAVDLREIKESIAKKSIPSGLSGPLQAMWREAAGDWDAAHEIVQDDESREAAWVHAYLHRKEGDEGNAAYWYSRAGRNKPKLTMEEEWERIVKELLEPA